MARFEWLNSYGVGHATIDEQHRQIFVMANDLYDALVSGNADDKASGALDALYSYVDKHFREEETLFSEIASTMLAAHKKEHAALAEEVWGLYNDIGMGAMDDAGRVLEQWIELRLLPHIAQSDQQALKSRTR